MKLRIEITNGDLLRAEVTDVETGRVVGRVRTMHVVDSPFADPEYTLVFVLPRVLPPLYDIEGEIVGEYEGEVRELEAPKDRPGS